MRATLALLLPAILATQSAAEPIVIALRAPDGSCTLRQVSTLELARTESALAAEAKRLEELAARLAQDALAIRFATLRERVPAHGDWAYDWVQSYIISFRILGRAAHGLAREVTQPSDGPAMSRITAEIAAPMHEAFRERVLAPALGRDGITPDVVHLGRVLDDAWRGALDQAATELAEGRAAQASAAFTFDLAAATAPLSPALAAILPDDPLDLMAREQQDAPAIFLRSMRPMAARVGGLAVRATEAGSILLTGGVFGYALGGLPGVALGLAGGVGVYWGLDWLIARADAALNRADFEAATLGAIDAAEQRLARELTAAVGAAFAARRAALRSAATGCP